MLGHQEDGQWVDLWQFVILPHPDGTSRLVLRTRTMMTGGFWTIIHLGIFIIERGMLLGIKAAPISLAKRASCSGSAPLDANSGSFPPLDPSPTPSSSDLPLTCQGDRSECLY